MDTRMTLRIYGTINKQILPVACYKRHNFIESIVNT